MLFSLQNEMLERKYTKRDAFILTGCDEEKYAGESLYLRRETQHQYPLRCILSPDPLPTVWQFCGLIHRELIYYRISGGSITASQQMRLKKTEMRLFFRERMFYMMQAVFPFKHFVLQRKQHQINLLLLHAVNQFLNGIHINRTCVRINQIVAVLKLLISPIKYIRLMRRNMPIHHSRLAAIWCVRNRRKWKTSFRRSCPMHRTSVLSPTVQTRWAKRTIPILWTIAMTSQ